MIWQHFCAPVFLYHFFCILWRLSCDRQSPGSMFCWAEMVLIVLCFDFVNTCAFFRRYHFAPVRLLARRVGSKNLARPCALFRLIVFGTWPPPIRRGDVTLQCQQPWLFWNKWLCYPLVSVDSLFYPAAFARFRFFRFFSFFTTILRFFAPKLRHAADCYRFTSTVFRPALLSIARVVRIIPWSIASLFRCYFGRTVPTSVFTVLPRPRHPRQRRWQTLIKLLLRPYLGQFLASSQSWATSERYDGLRCIEHNFQLFELSTVLSRFFGAWRLARVAPLAKVFTVAPACCRISFWSCFPWDFICSDQFRDHDHSVIFPLLTDSRWLF